MLKAIFPQPSCCLILDTYYPKTCEIRLMIYYHIHSQDPTSWVATTSHFRETSMLLPTVQHLKRRKLECYSVAQPTYREPFIIIGVPFVGAPSFWANSHSVISSQRGVLLVVLQLWTREVVLLMIQSNGPACCSQVRCSLKCYPTTCPYISL
jgi:hypothetical protein